MTNAKRKKVGIIGVIIFLAIIFGNRVTFNLIAVDVVAILLFAAAAIVAAALYIRDNAPLPRREMMKEFALIFLTLILIVFVLPAVL